MDLNLVREIVSMMENSKLSSMEIEIKDMRIKLEKNTDSTETPILTTTRTVEAKQYEAFTSSEVITGVETVMKQEKEDVECTLIKSPMVGTFYSAPSPGSEPFVTVGKTVKSGDVVCIIEAMKLLNEIESECNGTIIEVLVKDGEMVEYNQPLFKIKA
ncbi:acetyl-CoA carboxylase biotin carboxyl carrier protein [Clostridium thermarum]|uniref:acetyl-CoA carboxylase biotin carboxyl carrier protein n=1 Tax=Clostridium thermarum TaxID=1716543 RepID=UPI0013D765AB|nr:acetyl-CoA carboxylase biotin carboxyl carrier protein [Clostridium thermarum]